MPFDWDKIDGSLAEEPDWVDAEDLSRLSLERFIAELSPIRRDVSSGMIRLAGTGINGNSGSIEGVSGVMRNFQRLVLATGMSLEGNKSLRGAAPAHLVTRTRLNLNGSPLPGSLILEVVPDMPPSEEIAPTGQQGLLENPDTQFIDDVMREALALLNEGKRYWENPDTSAFLDRIADRGPRVASALRDFTDGLASFGFEPLFTWSQPRHPRVQAALSVSELRRMCDAIESAELEREPMTVRGTLRTVSEIKPWHLELEDGQLISIKADAIPKSVTSTLRTTMLVSVNVTVRETSGLASAGRTEYSATSVTVLRQETPAQAGGTET